MNDSHHTATNVQDGSKSGGAGTSSSGSTNSGSGTISGGNSKTANIKNGQRWLNSNYCDKLIQFCGAKLEVDGSYGPASRWGALAIWKDLMNRKYGTKLTPTNKNFYGSCKEVARKSRSSQWNGRYIHIHISVHFIRKRILYRSHGCQLRKQAGRGDHSIPESEWSGC